MRASETTCVHIYVRIVMKSVSEVPLYVNTRTRPRVFIAITVMSCVQMLFWCYLSYAALTDIRLLSTHTAGKHSDSSISKYSSLKWRVGLSAVALSVGTFFTMTSLMHPQRSVHQLLYLPKRELVRIGTYTPLGRQKTITVPLSTIKCVGRRLKTSQISLKVKGHSLYFLMDHQGSFPSPKLFDLLIATRK